MAESSCKFLQLLNENWPIGFCCSHVHWKKGEIFPILGDVIIGKWKKLVDSLRNDTGHVSVEFQRHSSIGKCSKPVTSYSCTYMLIETCSDNDCVLLERRHRTPKACRDAAAAAEKEYVIKLMANTICQHNLLTITWHNLFFFLYSSFA